MSVQTDPTARGRIFLSYARADAAIADRITNSLHQNGIQVWRDTERVAVGQSFVGAINQALEESSYVLLLVSPAALVSAWVSREWMSTLAAQNTALIPVKVERVELPAILRDKLFIDLTSSFDEGMAKLVDFFQRENSPPVRPTKSAAPTRALLAGATRFEIRRVAHACLDETGLRNYLYEIEVDPGSLVGTSLHERIMSLLHRLNEEGSIKEFLRCLERDRAACVAAQLKKAREAQARADALEF